MTKRKEKDKGKVKLPEGLVLRGSTYHIRITHPLTHKRIEETTGTKDLKQATEYLDKRKAEQWEEKMGKLSYTWDQAVARWLKEQHRMGKKSLDDDIAKLEWLKQHLSGLVLKDVTRMRVEDLLEMKEKEKNRYDEDLSGSTLNRYVALIRSIMRKAAYEWGMMLVADLPKFGTYKEGPSRKRFLTHEQARNLLKELPIHLRMVVLFGMVTGLRRKNILTLRWSQIDTKDNTLLVYDDEMKNEETLKISLNETALKVLKTVKATPAMAEAPVGHKDHGYVFVNNGVRIKEACTKAYYKALKRAGIPALCFHSATRHSWASWLRQAGVSLALIQEMGGWKSIKMVQRYAHIKVNVHGRDAAGILDGALLLPETMEAKFDALNDAPVDAAILAVDTAAEHDDLNEIPEEEAVEA